MPQQSRIDSLNICILARKKLPFNTRIVRQALSLSERGHRVTVVSLENPGPDQREMTPSVTYIESPLRKPFVLRLLTGLSSFRSRLVNMIYGLTPAYFRKSSKVLKAHVITSGKLSFGAFYWLGVWSSTLFKSIAIFILALQSPMKYKRSDILGFHVDKSFVDIVSMILLPYLNIYYNFTFSKSSGHVLLGNCFDVVQAHDSFALPAALQLSKTTGATLVYDAVEIPDDRSGQALQGTPRWLKKLQSNRISRAIGKSNCIITVGPGVAAWMQNRYSIEKPLIIRNCRLYEHTFGPSSIRTDVGVKNGDHLVLYINKIYPGQGVEQMLEALSYLPDNIVFATLGPHDDDVYIQRLCDMAVDLRVADRFKMLDTVSPTVLLPYASGADLGVIPMQNSSLNTFNALPNRLFELIMARLPIASSKLPDIEEIISYYQIGMVFDETDPKDIASVLSVMLHPDRIIQFHSFLNDAARDLCWENEGSKYTQAIEQTVTASSTVTSSVKRTMAIQ